MDHALFSSPEMFSFVQIISRKAVVAGFPVVGNIA